MSLVQLPSAAAVAAPEPDVRLQWWFDSWAIERLVWPLTKGRGVTVAVIDTGVNAGLPDLRNVVVPGKDFTGSVNDARKDAHEESLGHGTAMASLIASQGTGTGFVGIAPEARILPIISDLGESRIGPAVRYAVDRGAKVINISKGSSVLHRECPPRLQQAIAYAAHKDVIVVASAGNTGVTANFAEYPASCPGVVGVGAADNRASPWKNTQRQGYVTIAAPGVDIAALGKDGRVWPRGEGTSQAAALASGGFALIRSRYPAMSARDVVRLVTNTAVDIGPPGRDDTSGFGVMSLRRALRRLPRANSPNPVYERLDRAVATPNPAPPAAPSPAEAAPRKDTSAWWPAAAAAAITAAGAVLTVTARLRRTRAPSPPPGPGPTPPPPLRPGGHHRTQRGRRPNREGARDDLPPPPSAQE
ncbi:type VII secretion-associated serine protease mycosin [Thermomonospora umbrina]|uniref:Type VII secretion-associated serine protease mycosin n=2 Tax=Thermomonospora umbrina TaxID=111806 RepID=A0A3D9SWZ1_9ACTN|nr:type VII secretion-associated serine protease mycosin [Thermomonospora umbrina]